MEAKLEAILDFERNPIDESLKKLGVLYSIVLKKYKTALYELNKFEADLSERYAERYSYYKCDYDFQLTNAEIKAFIENDIETKELRLKIKNTQADINVLEKHLKNIEQTRWDIKTLIDFKKLERVVI